MPTREVLLKRLSATTPLTRRVQFGVALTGIMDHSTLHDLDNGCLLAVLKYLQPLPDLFNIARTCKRFWSLTCDRRLWLVVAPVAVPSTDLDHSKIFSTLEAAVLSSRPGDTIWLAPGVKHKARHVIVPWPLHLVGGGLQAEDTQLICFDGAEAALDFRATARVANLSLTASRGACILHRQGQLQVDRCHLECKTHGMAHLWSPLVTLASWQTTSKGAESTAPASPNPGIGRLCVRETSISGHSKAVNCAGTGTLQSVRAICGARHTLFWFEVDSSKPGRAQPGHHYWQSPALAQAPHPAVLVAKPAVLSALRGMSHSAVRAMMMHMRPTAASGVQARSAAEQLLDPPASSHSGGSRCSGDGSWVAAGSVSEQVVPGRSLHPAASSQNGSGGCSEDGRWEAAGSASEQGVAVGSEDTESAAKRVRRL